MHAAVAEVPKNIENKFSYRVAPVNLCMCVPREQPELFTRRTSTHCMQLQALPVYLLSRLLQESQASKSRFEVLRK